MLSCDVIIWDDNTLLFLFFLKTSLTPIMYVGTQNRAMHNVCKLILRISFRVQNMCQDSTPVLKLGLLLGPPMGTPLGPPLVPPLGTPLHPLPRPCCHTTSPPSGPLFQAMRLLRPRSLCPAILGDFLTHI